MAINRETLLSLLRYDFKRQQLMAVAISFILLAFFSLASLTGLRAWKAHEIHLKDASLATQNLARALAQHADDALKTTDVLLLSLVERAEAEGKSAAALVRLQNVLRMHVAGLPQMHGLFFFDRDGRYIASSQATLPSSINNSDRAYFIFHKSNPGTDSYVGPPIRSRTTGDWTITMSRRVNEEDGSFGGVMLATIHMKYFSEFHANLGIGKKGVVFITNKEGVLLTRHPFLEDTVGKRIKNGFFENGLFSSTPAGTFVRTSKMDGQERLYSYRYLERYPLVVAAALSTDEIFAGWFSALYADLLMLGLLALLLGLLGYRLVGQIKLSLNAEASLIETHDSLVKLNRTFELLAMEDSLTGLANRRRFDQALQAELSRARRENSSISLLMSDVDCFKLYNDTYGHQAGDDCLKAIGIAIGKVLYRTGDLAARFGGEEFAILLPHAGTEGAVAIAERIRLTIQNLDIPHKHNAAGVVTISMGVGTLSSFNKKPKPSDLIEAADGALYRAKAQGRNCVCSDRTEIVHEDAPDTV